MSPATLLPVGQRAVLVELASLAEVMAAAAWVRRAVAGRQPGFTEVLDVVPAARTVLVTLGERGDLERLRTGLRGLDLGEAAATAPPPGAVVEVAVHYEGQDLATVARLTGLTEDEVVRAHTGTPWQAAFGGFAPGFTYLVGGDPRLQVQRRAEPRTSVPAGAVALAGEFSAIYPRSSPGGWQLIGHTDVRVWDLAREPAALLQPGVTVRFLPA
jgi:KipI family sensor histidine kinase inhibitor